MDSGSLWKSSHGVGENHVIFVLHNGQSVISEAFRQGKTTAMTTGKGDKWDNRKGSWDNFIELATYTFVQLSITK